jgi:hypothetical protein
MTAVVGVVVMALLGLLALALVVGTAVVVGWLCIAVVGAVFAALEEVTRR